jgi:hypothetical protein
MFDSRDPARGVFLIQDYRFCSDKTIGNDSDGQTCFCYPVNGHQMQREAVMTANPCLVLYGNSVFLAGIKAELERRITLELITIEIGRPDVTELIRARKPRAVIFDMGTGPLDCVISLLREQPDLLLIGVDPSRDEMLVISSHPAQALSMSDLVEVIHNEKHREGQTR